MTQDMQDVLDRQGAAMVPDREVVAGNGRRSVPVSRPVTAVEVNISSATG